ncbi:hypothetical protein [Bradyrhizobium sp. HKCCYLRH3061]|uniref:hypothetical protein n=1 Tax=Bradyrhizobium TaxID=374 RepID=UPI003EB82D24
MLSSFCPLYSWLWAELAKSKFTSLQKIEVIPSIHRPANTFADIDIRTGLPLTTDFKCRTVGGRTRIDELHQFGGSGG